MTTIVSQYPPVTAGTAAAHFAARLSLETDCADVHSVLQAGNPDFVLVDTRNSSSYDKAHVPGAINITHGKITAERMAAWPADTLFIVYCAGPHCNAADQGAMKLARLGRPVKLMLGGLWGWIEEGYTLAHGADQAT